MDAYELLGVNRDANQDQIKLNYHKLLLIHHPDKNFDQLNHKIDNFIKIQSAFKLLSNHESRKLYDSLLKQMELKKKANDLLSDDDEFILSLEKDFEFDTDNDLYLRICRCGGSYNINKTNINEILSSSFNLNQEKFFNLVDKDLKENNSIHDKLVLSINCDTCSLIINVCIL